MASKQNSAEYFHRVQMTAKPLVEAQETADAEAL